MSPASGGTSFPPSPPTRTVPELLSSRPALIRSALVLPHPDGPTKTTNSPSSISRSSSRTARVPSAYTLLSCSSPISATATSTIASSHLVGSASLERGGRPPTIQRPTALRDRTSGSPRHAPHLTGRRRDRPPRRRPLRARDLPELHGCDRRLADRQVGRAGELSRPVARQDLPRRALAHVPLHGHLPGDRDRRRRSARPRPRAQLPRPVADALLHP